jgi:hypothetical protein
VGKGLDLEAARKSVAPGAARARRTPSLRGHLSSVCLDGCGQGMRPFGEAA